MKLQMPGSKRNYLKLEMFIFYKHSEDFFFNQVKTKYLPTLIQWMMEQSLLKLKWRDGEDKENTCWKLMLSYNSFLIN